MDPIIDITGEPIIFPIWVLWREKLWKTEELEDGQIRMLVQIEGLDQPYKKDWGREAFQIMVDRANLQIIEPSE